jgi:PD-(D/E)XK nuclease superfamily protein
VTIPPYLGPRGPLAEPLAPQLLVGRSMAAAERGRAAHREKERGVLFPALWPSLPNGGMARGYGFHEVAVSYCCKTGMVRWLADVDERRKNLWKALQCEHAVVGTADWLAVTRDGTLWVDDLKTGWSIPEVRTPQLLFYALCLHDMVTSGVSRWAIGTPGSVALSVTHWPRANPRQPPVRYWDRTTSLGLEDFRIQLTEAWQRTTRDRTALPGAHCTYCPSIAWCPAQVCTKD